MIEYVSHMGSDLTVVNAARVSLGNYKTDFDDRDQGLINYLMREKHASPFEHCTMTVLVKTSIAVAREWMRHRTQSFNEFSTRYSSINQPRFHVPEIREQVGTPGNYKFTPIEDEETGKRNIAIFIMQESYKRSYDTYERLVNMGIAKEVARSVLPLGMETQFYATSNLRNWFNFLSLRTSEQALKEIRDAAFEVEYFVELHFPHSYRAWVDNGRGAL